MGQKKKTENEDKEGKKGKGKKKDEKKKVVAKPKHDGKQRTEDNKKARMKSVAKKLRRKLERGHISMMAPRHDRLLDHIERLEAGKGNKGNAPRSPAAYYPRPAQATIEKEKRPPREFRRPKPNLAPTARQEAEKLLAEVEAGVYKGMKQEGTDHFEVAVERIAQLFLDGKASSESLGFRAKVMRAIEEGKITETRSEPTVATNEPPRTPAI